jgi:hypothetical protein
MNYQQVLNLLYELPEDGTDMPKHVGVVKDHNFKCVCGVCTELVLQRNKYRYFQVFTVSKDQAAMFVP